MSVDRPGWGDEPADTRRVDHVRGTEHSRGVERPQGRVWVEGDNPAWVDEVLTEAADTWIRDNKTDRPWLARTADAAPATRRAYLELDTNGSHVLPRHSVHGDETGHIRRLTRLEDPAQTDPDQRAQGVDGVHGGRHYCAPLQTRITDADALAETLDEFTDEPPPAEKIDSFEGGTVLFAFKRHPTGDGYTLTTFFPDPPRDSASRENTRD